MVCGLCHGEDPDHPQSSSGPTRCKYLTHREECPGNFRTSCAEHTKILETKDSEPERKIEHTEVDSDHHQPQDNSDTKPKGEPQALFLQQVQALVKSGQNEQTLDEETMLALSNLFKTPTSLPPSSQPSSQSSSRLAAAAPTTANASLSQGSIPPSFLSGLDQLARQHVADNQAYLEQPQEVNSYSGPNMKQIRQDTATEEQVTKVIEALKNISPVLGQAAATVPVLPGISPLEQLHHQISNTPQLPLPSPHVQAPANPHQPNDLLNQLQLLLHGDRQLHAQ